MSQKFSARGMTSLVRLLHVALVNFSLVADLAISVFREVNINTDCLVPLVSVTLKRAHAKNSRVRLCAQGLFHPQDYL